MDCQILKLVLTRDKPGLTKNSWFSGSTKTIGCIAACFLSNLLHCKNRERQISKQVPSTTTGVTWYTDHMASPPKPAQGCEGRAGAESNLGAAPGPGRKTLVRWSNRRAAAAGGSPAVPSLEGLSKARCIYTYIHIYIYIHIYTYIHIYIYIHILKHT